MSLRKHRGDRNDTGLWAEEINPLEADANIFGRITEMGDFSEGKSVPGASGGRVKELEQQLESALQVVGDGQWVFRKFRMTRVKLIVPDDLTEADVNEFGMMLSGMNNAVQFWIGDWANLYIHEGMNQFEVSAVYQQLAENFGFEPGTIKDYAWVCRVIDASLRKDAPLHFSHHKEAAKLPEYAGQLLAAAANNGWSVRQMRDEIAKLKGKSSDSPKTVVARFQSQYQKFARSQLQLATQAQTAERRQMADMLRDLADKIERG